MFVISNTVKIRESDVPIPSKDPKDIEVPTQERDDLVDHVNASIN
jgi:hypothetical protein